MPVFPWRLLGQAWVTLGWPGDSGEPGLGDHSSSASRRGRNHSSVFYVSSALFGWRGVRNDPPHTLTTALNLHCDIFDTLFLTCLPAILPTAPSLFLISLGCYPLSLCPLVPPSAFPCLSSCFHVSGRHSAAHSMACMPHHGGETWHGTWPLHLPSTSTSPEVRASGVCVVMEGF